MSDKKSPYNIPQETNDLSSDHSSIRGGKRAGSGRPKGTGKYGEPTKAIRVPQGSVSCIKDFLKNEYSLENSSNIKLSVKKNSLQKDKQYSDAPAQIKSNVVILGDAKNSLENPVQSIPLFSSKISAGLPSFADDDLDNSIDLNNYLVEKPNSTFMLKVQGMSMRDAGILPDDVLIVDRSQRATHNKIVIAALDGQLTVKRLFKRTGILKLIPENPDYPEILIQEESDLVIWGVVIGSFRRFQSTKFS